jgi:hypothetical protein
MDYLLSMAFSIIFEVLKMVVKDPNTKEKMQSVLRKLAKAILAAYPDDPVLTDAAFKFIATAPPQPDSVEKDIKSSDLEAPPKSRLCDASKTKLE